MRGDPGTYEGIYCKILVCSMHLPSAPFCLSLDVPRRLLAKDMVHFGSGLEFQKTSVEACSIIFPI